MKSKRLNFCPPVLCVLHDMGISSVRLCNAVNSALGELESKSEEGKLGDGRVTKTHYKVTETVTAKYEGDKTTAPLLFDAWHSAVAKAHKIASFNTVAIPGVLTEWVNKFRAEKKEVEAEKAASVPAS